MSKSQTVKKTQMVKTLIHGIQDRHLKNNTQKVGLRLLNAIGTWIPTSRLEKIPSATSRVRDLRKDQFGSFDVECQSSNDLNKRTAKKTFYYRINPDNVTEKQLRQLFLA